MSRRFLFALSSIVTIYQANSTHHSSNHLKAIGDFFYELKGQALSKEDGDIVYRGLAALTPYKLDVKHADLINMDKIHVALMQMKKIVIRKRSM